MTEWTPERIEQLKTLWGLGESSSIIADKMGLPSRSAVLGKVHRLRLPLRSVKTSNVRPTKDKEIISLAQREVSPPEIAKLVGRSKTRVYEIIRRARLAGEDIPSAPRVRHRRRYVRSSHRPTYVVCSPRRPHIPPARQDEPASLGLTLMELEPGQCRWPHGDGPFLFCGHPVEGQSYCSYHCRLAYESIDYRRQKSTHEFYARKYAA